MEHPAYSLAVLCSVGGVGGYIRRGSVPSLIAGLTIGGLYGYSGKLLQDNVDYGIYLASAASALLFIGSLPRAIKTQKAMPVGLSIIGLTTLAYYGKKYSDFFLD